MHELLAAGIDCRPVDHHGGALRVNITISEPDGTTTKLNSPGPTVDRRRCSPRSPSRCAAAPPRADWIVLAGSLPPGRARRVVRRPGRRPARAPAPASPSTPATPRCGRWSTRLPRQRPAPDEAERRGARLLHRRRRRRARVRPGGGRRGRPHPRRPRRRDRAGHARPATAPCSSPPTAPGTPLPRPPTVVSTVGAGDSSLFGYLLGDIRQRTPDQRLALAVAYGSAAAGLPGTTIPHPSQVTPELVSVRDLDLTQGG